MQSYLQSITDAARAFEALFRVARLLGDDTYTAARAANKVVTPAIQENLLQRLGFGHIEDAE